MTPLEFFIAVHNSDATDALDEVHTKLDGFKGEVADLYEGPARESRLRTEIKGIGMELARGASPLDAFLNSMERLSEMGRFSGGLLAGVAALAAIVTEEVAAKKASLEFLDSFQKAMGGGDLKGASLEQLQGFQRAMDETNEKFKKLTWVQWLMNRGVFVEARRLADARQVDLNTSTDESLAAKIHAETTRLKYEASGREDIEAEIADVREKYGKLQAEADAAGRVQASEEYGDQMLAQIQIINDKSKKVFEEGQLEAMKKKAQLQSDLDRARQEETERTPADRTKDYTELLYQIAHTEDGSAANLALQIQASHLRKEIANDEKEAAEKAAAVAEKEALAKKSSAEITEKLRQEVIKAQFESLSKEEQVIVLRTAQASLQKNIVEAEKFGAEDNKLKFQKELAEVNKQLKEAEKNSSPYHGLNADDALRGNMAAGAFSRVANDGANRAEKQRDDMVGYLKTIASRGGLNDLGAF